MENSIERKPITDEEIAQNPNMYRDEDGVYLKLVNGKALIEPSPEYITKNSTVSEYIPEPTTEEYMMELDYRLSVIELGL